MHGGHISRVNDLDWNPAVGSEFVLASVEEENTVHIFEIANCLLQRDDRSIVIN